MMAIFKTKFVYTLVFLWGVMSLHAQLVHPGGWHSQNDLTTMRSMIQAGVEPWKSGWDEAKNDGPNKNFRATVSSLVTDRNALSEQGHDTYLLAIKWVATGDQEYADTAISVINDWVQTVNEFDVEGPTLRLSTAGGYMAQAAEILAHGFNGAAGWPSSEVRAAQTWFKDKIYDPWTNTGRARSANWGTSCVGGNMSMAVFCDNVNMFNQQVDAYKFGYQDTSDGCAGVEQYIFSPTGQAFESGRDQAHVQGGIGHLVEAALCAWNQGVDIVSYADYRLVAGVEYHARYNAGYNDLPWTENVYNPCNLRILGSVEQISAERRGYESPMYFMCDKLFAQAGKAHPNTDNVITDRDYLPEFTNTSHPGWGQFTFVHTDATNPIDPIDPTPPPLPVVNLVHITKRNAPGFAIDGGNGGSNGQDVTLSVADPSDEGQLWLEIDLGNGFYAYEKYGAGYSLDGGNGGTLRQNVYLWQTSIANQNQHWQKEPVGDGGFKLIKRNATGFAINGGSGGAEGRSINMWNSASTNQNLQWIITYVNTTEEVRLEAEDFDSMSGIQTEASTESGENVGYINNGDWLRFDDVNLSGITNMDARVATRTAGGTLEVRTGSVNGTLIGTINIGNTGGYQDWITLNTNISNASGTQDVYLVFKGGNGYLFNVNWIEFNTNSRSNKEIDEVLETVSEVKLYPNPIVSTTTIRNAANSTITIYAMDSSVLYTQTISSDNELIDISSLATGIYFAEINEFKGLSTIVKLVKK